MHHADGLGARPTPTLRGRSIDSAPVKCNCLLIENTADRLGLFTQRVQEFYRRQLLLQLHRMLGSLDALGVPLQGLGGGKLPKRAPHFQIFKQVLFPPSGVLIRFIVYDC